MEPKPTRGWKLLRLFRILKVLHFTLVQLQVALCCGARRLRLRLSEGWPERDW